MFATLAVLVTVSDALALVKVHTTFEPGATALALSESAPVTKFVEAVPPVPIPVQLAEERPKPVGMVSVIVVATEVFVSVMGAVETAVPEVVVVRLCAPMPLLPLKLNAPTAPLEILLNVMVAGMSLLATVHVAVWLSARVRLLPDCVPPTQVHALAA